MNETPTHICGASGFGFGARDGCPACEVVWERINAKRAASAPASPAAGGEARIICAEHGSLCPELRGGEVDG